MRIRLFLFISSLVCIQLLNAQSLTTKNKKAASLFQKATSFYSSDKYNLTIQALDQALNKDENFIEAYLLLADVYHQQEDFDSEKSSLLKAIEIDSTFFITSYFNIGVASFHINEFDEAKVWFEKYQSKTRSKLSKQKADRWIEKTAFVKEIMNKPKVIEPQNLGLEVNSHYDEYWPSITADENVLIFTVLAPKDTARLNAGSLPKTAQYFQEDFYRVIKDEEGNWASREVLPSPLNTESNEGAQSLSADGNWMFFTACGRKDSKGSCDIYFSKKTKYGWSEPVNVGSPVNSPYWESQPSFSADGRTLYFTSNRSGGFGGKDIWRAKVIGYREDGSPFFGKPENLGPNINTQQDENSPFIHHDNKTLYFSSEGWPGLGNMDLFVSRKDENGKFGESVNLGYPINTTDDEIGLIVTASARTAYYSSSRFDTSLGGKDLYSFTLPVELMPNPVSYVRGKVFDNKTKERLQANFELKNIETGDLIVEALSTDFSGEFLVCLPTGAGYALNVSKPGYLFYSDHFDMNELSSAENPFELNVYLNKIEVGQQIILKNVFYQSNSFLLKASSHVELDKLNAFLAENPDLQLQITGHTDNVGGEDYNRTLSKNRAEQVYNYLVKKGIDKARLKYKGAGMSQPIESNDTPEGRAKNRRTEVQIIE
ncbi:OmpA family protein [Saccharicrinis aurantiacus]|uniref:OmpA family protein n=1 Tax=Saccharicrinis aurantiacus TaxID=1849719 RepID=UPI00094F8BA8|nr:OmpA family protein [Saccharicrinis aurantiacus]